MRESIVRLLSAAIACILCASMASCASDGTKPGPAEETDAAVTTGAKSEMPQYEGIYREKEDSIPKLDFDGEDVVFLSVDRVMYDTELSAEELISEPLNDAVYYRNLNVEERLNVNIIDQREELYHARDLLTLSLNAGDDSYQVFAHEAAPVVNYSFNGYFLDLLDLDESYLDLSEPWYSQDFFEKMGMSERVYCLTGALSLSMYRSLHVTYFNRQLAEDLNVGDLYQTVEDGRWTIDYLRELIPDMYRDLNGNSEIDDEDFFGYRSPIYWALDSYWTAFDMRILELDGNDDFIYVMDEGKLASAVEKIADLIWFNRGSFHDHDKDKNNAEEFASGNCLFLFESLRVAENETLRNMENGYGILPVPKWDEKQKDYYGNPYEVFTVFAVPVTCQNTGMVTAVLEAMSAESWRKVLPIYGDVVMKGKYMNDPQSRQMLDRIFEGMRFEAALLYPYQLHLFSTDVLRYVIEEKRMDTFASTLAKNLRNLNILLPELNEARH